MRNLNRLVAAAAMGSTLLTGNPKTLEAQSANSPRQTVTELQGKSIESKRVTETTILSVHDGGRWYRVILNEDAKFGFTAAQFKNGLRDLELQIGREYVEDDWIYSYHDHPTDRLKKNAAHLGLQEKDFEGTADVLTGPSWVDCFRNKNFGRKFINIVVESGGMWVCSNPREVKTDFDSSMDSLVIGNRSNYLRGAFFKEYKLTTTDEEKSKIIHKFENDYFNLVGARIKYLPPSSTEEEILRTVKEIL